ncbi:hypothetical protein B9T62_11115 [Paenibacillus donghaensis]|uniref:Transcriptional regulator n=1 Tax=Paenibacillus donghaensis TaxID=414771 RepID=A0A2Z2K7Z9_9BACL|nr:hypothetical protein B9T62_11115 [Paenibacillus donghaensis]
MNILDKLPLPVKREVRSKMETEFERYRLWKFITFQEREVSITAAWSDTPKGFTGTVSDQTGNIAAYNVNEPERRRQFCERVEYAVSRLPHKEQQVITQRYMQREVTFDFVVFNQTIDPPMSRGTYDKIKARAMTMLAMALNIEVEGLKEIF